jgi:5-methylcytosine-specific restriction endonuclease McrA
MRDDQTSKVCTRCGAEKSIDEFYLDKRIHNGRDGRCKVCRRKISALWRLMHRGPWLDASRKWYQDNKDRCLVLSKAWYGANKERRHSSNVQWKKLHPEKGREYSLARRLKNTERYRLQRSGDGAKRRARKKGATVSRVDFNAVAKRDRMTCYLCNRRVAKSDLSFDHVTPLAKGGVHAPENLKVAHLKCNISKGAKLVLLPFEASGHGIA